MREYYQLSSMGCSTRACLSKGKGSKMVVLTNNSTFTVIVFYFYLELVIVSVNIYCTCTVVYICIILLEVIQGLWRYTQRKLNPKGHFYKGIIRECDYYFDKTWCIDCIVCDSAVLMIECLYEGYIM